MTTARDVNGDETKQADVLRAAMVAELRELGVIRSDRVAAAVGIVLRHLFAPREPLERAYAAKTVLQTKRDERGVAISMISAADIQAMMLEQAQLEPGMRVLEISSHGYNAALIAELVGESGQLTAVDIDPEVIDRTRRCLAVAGYDSVNAVVADADGGRARHAAGGGLEQCHHRPIRAVGHTHMWLATALPGFCRIMVDRSLDTGLISPPGSHSTAIAVVADESLAYVTTRRADDENVAEQLRVWHREHRDGPGPGFRVYPAGTSDDQLPEGRVIDKTHSRVTISWPQAMSTHSRSERPVRTPTTSQRLENQN